MVKEVEGVRRFGANFHWELQGCHVIKMSYFKSVPDAVEVRLG